MNHNINKYDKKYFEKYAQLTLEYIYPTYFKNFFNADSPDIQNTINSIGIEVCRAETDVDGKYIAFVNEYIGSNKTDEELTNLLCKRLKQDTKKTSFLIKTCGDSRVFSQHKGLIDFDTYVSKIICAIKKKNNKIHIYKEKHNWKELGLYLFANITFQDYDIRNIISQIPKTKNHFDFFIINCFEILYLIKYNGSFQKYDISQEQLSNIKSKSGKVN